MPETMREHLAAIRELAHAYSRPGIQTEIFERSVAALVLLDEAAFGYDIDHGWREDRLVPDPGMNPELRDPDPQPDAPQAYDEPTGAADA